MITKLHKNYFQKSKVFLFPALGIERDADFKPTQTFISLDDIINPEDIKLICLYKTEKTESFEKFEEQIILSNPLLTEIIAFPDYSLYIFDYESYMYDWYNFILGKYSKLSAVLKQAIMSYYEKSKLEYDYIDSFLNPEKYYDLYSKLLDVDNKILKNVGELCDPCDLIKENYSLCEKDLYYLNKKTLICKKN
jgi:hypothetical protein